ncbi:trichothecene 3-O-acetyltransferase [Hypoxylon trugodes]|uniref:trichothecene 3-O-acetyltransferase n=1 Tax=Hypoxylon trugodes TaxID=326681 RepID=UPI0021974745|nr:trichothecene 3-O-acetyltransferase [Hypoxylon trugodes]KAI1389675.1 trichothecene 3-O-acetyltransferase [Hypoxylon trugodes]
MSRVSQDGIALDIFGQMPATVHSYTGITLCFPLLDGSQHPAVVSTLTAGLERLSASFPWVAGQVTNEGSGEDNSGIYKITPFENIPRLVVKDLRQDGSMPTMGALRDANFPMSMLDELVISPRATISLRPPENDPVLLIQANFITGGLLLTFSANHNAMDMAGQAQVLHLLSKACRNEPFTQEELKIGNCDRRNIVPLLQDYQPGPEVSRQIAKKPGPQAPANSGANATKPAPPRPLKCTWANFIFDAASLSALKAQAAETVTSGFISTDDAITALIWQCITRARSSRLEGRPVTEATLGRSVNVRSYLDIPETYPGFIQNMTYRTLKLQEVADGPLGAVASYLRAGLDRESIKYQTRSAATLLDSTPNKRTINPVGSLDLTVDIIVSSWVKTGCYGLDFGLGLGKPESVRRPRLMPLALDSLVYLLPKAPSGEIVIAICLRDEDMTKLKADETFAKYGRFGG